MRESFIFYSSFAQAAQTLGDKARLKLYDAVIKLGLCCAENVTELEQVCNEIETSLAQNRNAFAQFLLIKPQIIANFTRYLNGKKGKDFGMLGGAPKGNKNASKNNPKTTPNVNVNVNDNVNVIKENNNLTVITKESENQKPKEEQIDLEEWIEEKKQASLPAKQTKFKKPTLDEVEDYIHEKGLSVDAKKFYDYFSEGDWVDSSGKKVKNWKQKLITWDGRGQNRGVSIAKPRMTRQEEIEQHNLKCLAKTFGYGEGFESGF